MCAHVYLSNKCQYANLHNVQNKCYLFKELVLGHKKASVSGFRGLLRVDSGGKPTGDNDQWQERQTRGTSEPLRAGLPPELLQFKINLNYRDRRQMCTDINLKTLSVKMCVDSALLIELVNKDACKLNWRKVDISFYFEDVFSDKKTKRWEHPNLQTMLDHFGSCYTDINFCNKINKSRKPDLSETHHETKNNKALSLTQSLSNTSEIPP